MANKASPASAHPRRNRAAANTDTRRALIRWVHAGGARAAAPAATGTTSAPAAPAGGAAAAPAHVTRALTRVHAGRAPAAGGAAAGAAASTGTTTAPAGGPE
jgi:hypothetical protein